LRKFLIGGLAAIASVALVTGAVAQSPDVQITGKVKPTKGGTKKTPKNGQSTLFLRNNVPNTTAGTIEVDLPKNYVLNTTAFKKNYCSVSKINAQGADACKKALGGPVGFSQAVVDPAGTKTPLLFRVTTYVGAKNKLTFFLQQIQPQGSDNLSNNLNALKDNPLDPNGVVTAISGTISNKGGKFGKKLVIKIPPDLQQPAPGVYSALTSLQNTFGTAKKNSLVQFDGCPSNGKHVFGVKLTFAPNPGAPPKPSATGEQTVKCS
jgi:hypothetical protein